MINRDGCIYTSEGKCKNVHSTTVNDIQELEMSLMAKSAMSQQVNSFVGDSYNGLP